MPVQLFINLPVSDLQASVRFYKSLGFKPVPQFSNELAAAMAWSDEIMVMLLTRAFYQNFIENKKIADTRQASGVLLCLTLDSPAAVKKFVAAAKKAGGRAYQVHIPGTTDAMDGWEVEDPDGHIWEPLFMPAPEASEPAGPPARPLPKLSQPALRALASIGIHNADQLRGHTESELMALHGFGPKALYLLRQAGIRLEK